MVDGEKPRERVLDSPGLVGWMAADWTLRFAGAAIFGIFFGLVTVAMGEYGFSVVFFLIGGVGIAGAWHMTQAKA